MNTGQGDGFDIICIVIKYKAGTSKDRTACANRARFRLNSFNKVDLVEDNDLFSCRLGDRADGSRP